MMNLLDQGWWFFPEWKSWLENKSCAHSAEWLPGLFGTFVLWLLVNRFRVRLQHLTLGEDLECKPSFQHWNTGFHRRSFLAACIAPNFGCKSEGKNGGSTCFNMFQRAACRDIIHLASPSRKGPSRRIKHRDWDLCCILLQGRSPCRTRSVCALCFVTQLQKNVGPFAHGHDQVTRRVVQEHRNLKVFEGVFLRTKSHLFFARPIANCTPIDFESEIDRIVCSARESGRLQTGQAAKGVEWSMSQHIDSIDITDRFHCESVHLSLSPCGILWYPVVSAMARCACKLVLPPPPPWRSCSPYHMPGAGVVDMVWFYIWQRMVMRTGWLMFRTCCDVRCLHDILKNVYKPTIWCCL